MKKISFHKKDYKFSATSQSPLAICAFIGAIISLILLPVVINMSYKAQGQATAKVGVLGLFAFLLAILCWILCSLKKKDDDVYQTIPKVGVWLSVIATVLWVALYALGWLL